MEDNLKYPIGRFKSPADIDFNELLKWIAEIEKFPSELEKNISGRPDKELNKTYRTGGWSALQVIHHCADSHANAFIRFKLTLTENEPHIKPYKEEKWAELPDTLQYPAEESVKWLKILHARWVFLLRNTDFNSYNRVYFHPEMKKNFSLYEATALYAWHCNHHLQHIKLALNL